MTDVTQATAPESATQSLTPEHLFAAPGLRTQPPTQMRIAPSGKFVAYLKASTENPLQMDLWRYDIGQQAHSLWVSAATFENKDAADVTALTDVERAERERKRQFTFGITAYSWLGKNDQALVSLDGQAYLVEAKVEVKTEAKAVAKKVAAKKDANADTNTIRAPRLLSDAAHRQSAYKTSPNGNKISFVRNGDLYIQEIVTDFTQALDEDSDKNSLLAAEALRITRDASDTISNGLADFLAAEEMHRFDGHWWSPCEQYLFYCKVDNSPVAISYRLEIDADGSKTVEQRYPYTGKDNPHVCLYRYDLGTTNTTLIWEPTDSEVYLARINPLQTGLYIQVQDRLQQTLWLKKTEYVAHKWQTLFTDRSTTWVNLTEDLRQLNDGRILFSTEAEGCRKAFILDGQGNTTSLTGPQHINQVLSVNDTHAYVCGWDQCPIENHLFRIALAGDSSQQITHAPGWHETALNLDQGLYLDRFSDEHHPLEINLLSLDSNQTLTSLFSEKINNDHPYKPFHAHHVISTFGEIKAGDGQSMYYRLTPPADISGTHPTIVYVYGGPGAQKVRQEWGSLLVQMFCQHGYGVLELDNRGSTNRGRFFEAPLYRNMGSPEVDDQVLGLSVLAQTQWADLSRVGIFGHSYGGFMTLMSLCKAPDHFKAGVAVAPVSDWEIYDTHYTERYMGLPNDNVEGYKEGNVLTHVDKLSSPLLLIHGMADDNVLFTHSTMLMSELQKRNKAFELMTYPGAKHSMQETHVSIHRFNLILDFFNRKL